MRDIDLKPRWFYSFDNFKRALMLLKKAIEIKKSRQITQLEKEGMIQRFEYKWELGWKLLKDYLEYKSIILDTITPASTIKAAFEAKIIKSGDLWMQALDERNKMSHIPLELQDLLSRLLGFACAHVFLYAPQAHR